MTDELQAILEAAKPKDAPIAEWHVGLIKDIQSGKDVKVETVAAIQNLERLLFQAETAIVSALAALAKAPPTNGGDREN